MIEPATNTWPIQKALLAFMLALFVAFLPMPSWFENQDSTDQYFEQSLQQTLTAYAAVRVLNASVSVIQESQVQVQPAGMGLSLALGQMLDPLNDMTERASDVLVWSAASLGIQKLIYEMTDAVFRPLLSVLLVFLGFCYLCAFKKPGLAWPNQVLRLSVALIILRIFLPVSAFTSEQLQQHFFTPKINAAYSAIHLSFNPDSLGSMPQPPESTWDKLTGAKQNFSEKADVLRQAFKELVQKADTFVDNLLLLMTLFLGLFLLQLLLPIAGVYILWRLSRMFL